MYKTLLLHAWYSYNRCPVDRKEWNVMEQTEIRHLLKMDTEENRILLQSNDKCDKYDYLTAAACGVIGGIIDIFLVGAPRNSILGNWTDEQVDDAVKNFARKVGWNPRETRKDNVGSAIGYLEQNFKVNYDQRYSSEVENLFDMSTRNHHMLSLSHSPDMIGLFFSVLNQFTSTSSFVANGQVITINTKTFELQGNHLISKLFSGIANWFGHIMSDIAGSSGSRGNKGRGTGVAMPFYELFQFCRFGSFAVKKEKQDLATIAVRAFQEGYDFRFGLATAIPVIITDLSIRFIWSFRQHFQYGKPLTQCIPTNKHADLRVMLLFGSGTLCAMDGIHAGVSSGGNFLIFFMRLNLFAWLQFTILVCKEVCIKVGIADALQKNLEAYRRINEALLLYLYELKKIDIKLFKKESEAYNQVINRLNHAVSGKELNAILLSSFDDLEINKPWKGDFNEHMLNKDGFLRFE
ncbi:MAG: hypothetical protein ACI4C1_05125 [Lachnospiraceae bacterium]